MKASYLKPLLPLRDIVIFPSMVVPLFVGREKSIKALQEVMKQDKSIILATQKNSEIDDPTGQDLYQFGCLSKVLQLLKLPDGTVKVLVEGEKRVKILKHDDLLDKGKLIVTWTKPYLPDWYCDTVVQIVVDETSLPWLIERRKKVFYVATDKGTIEVRRDKRYATKPES